MMLACGRPRRFMNGQGVHVRAQSDGTIGGAPTEHPTRPVLPIPSCTAMPHARRRSATRAEVRRSLKTELRKAMNVMPDRAHLLRELRHAAIIDHPFNTPPASVPCRYQMRHGGPRRVLNGWSDDAAMSEFAEEMRAIRHDIIAIRSSVQRAADLRPGR